MKKGSALLILSIIVMIASSLTPWVGSAADTSALESDGTLLQATATPTKNPDHQPVHNPGEPISEHPENASRLEETDIVPLSTTIFSDNFSGGYPGAWTIGHDGGGGTYAWAWPNDYAHAYADPSGGMYYYPNDLHVYMERRGVSLSGYDTATLSFDYIVDTESGYDEFTVNIRDQYGSWHTLYVESGVTDPLNWSHLDLNLDAFAGQSNLYIQFRFDSDLSISGSPYDGVYVDNVSLTADTIAPPDLVVSSASVDQSVVFPRDGVSASATVRNDGGSTAGSSYLYYYFSKDTSADSSEYIDDDYVSSLSPGASSSESDAFTIPDLDRTDSSNFGTWYVLYIADGGNDVAEGNEGNNQVNRSITVARPTLSNYTASTTSANAGDTITLNFYINNPDTTTRTIGLGASIRRAGTSTWIDDTSNDVTVSVPPGTSWHSRQFEIPLSAMGTYDVAWGLHSGLPSGSTYLYDYRERISFLTVSNVAPTLNLTSPSSNISVSQGSDVTIQWSDSDPDDNAYISLAYDVDSNPQNGGHAWIDLLLPEDPDGSGDSYSWSTTGVPEGTYYLWGMISDSNNPEQYSVAPGRVTITPAPGSISVTVHNVDNEPWSGAEVVLYDESWSVPPIDTHLSGSGGVVPTFTDLPPGTYHIEVYHTPGGQTPAETELWGSETVSVTSGDDTTIDFHRSWPTINFNNPSAVTVPSNVVLGTSAAVQVEIINPLGGSYETRVFVMLDRDGSAPYDIAEYLCTPSSVTIVGTSPTVFDCPSPAINIPGTYQVYYRIEALAPSGWVVTDQNDWGHEFNVAADISLHSIQVFDLDGDPRTRYYPGETLQIVASATNNGPSIDVLGSLEVDDDLLPGTASMYDSHQQSPSEDVSIAPFLTGETEQFHFYWSVPESTLLTPIYWAFGIHSSNYAHTLALLDWHFAFDVGSLGEVDEPIPMVAAVEGEILPIHWRTVTYDSNLYDVELMASAANVPDLNARIASSALYGGRTDQGLVDAITVRDSSGDPITDPVKALEIIVANNNISHYRLGSHWSAYDFNSIDPMLLIEGETRTDFSGNDYQIWAPAQTRGWWRDLFLYPGLDDYDKREELYQELLLHLILQPEIMERMVDDGTAYRQFLQLAEKGIKAAEGLSRANQLLDALDNLEVNEFGTTTLTADDYHAIVVYARYGELPPEFVNAQNNMLDNVELVLHPISTGLEIHNQILKKQFEASLVNQVAYMRMEHLEQWINTNAATLDPALVAAFPLAKQDVIQSSIDNFSALGTAVETLFADVGTLLEHAEYLTRWTSIVNSLFIHNASLGLYSHLATNVMLPWILSAQIALQTIEDIDYVRSISLAATLYRLFEPEFDSVEAQVISGDNSVEKVREVGLFDNYGYYLAHYFHFYYLEAVELGGFWDWVNPVNWPKVIGQMLASAFGSRQDVIDYFESQIDASYGQLVHNALPPTFKTRQDAVSWFGENLSIAPNPALNELELFFLQPGEQKTVTFQVENAGGDADPSYLSVSFDPQLSLVSTPAEWVVYPIGTELYGLGDTLEPTYVSEWPLAEVTEPFPSGDPPKFHMLTFTASTPGTYSIKYRSAMIPSGLSGAESLVARHPTEGDLDQQDYPAKQVAATISGDPAPSLTSNLSSTTILEGDERVIEFTLDNSSGGWASDTFVDISVTPGLDIVDVTPILYWERYEIGETIYHRDGTTFSASNLLYSMHAPVFPAGASMTYKVTVRGDQHGSDVIYFRAALNPITVDPDYLSDSFVRDPSGPGTGVGTDQQGWSAYMIPVSVLQNELPTINSSDPASPVYIETETTQSFSVSAVDPEGEPLTYEWYLDGQSVGSNSPVYDYQPAAGEEGLHSLIVYVKDGVLASYLTWEIHVEDPSVVCHDLLISHTGNGADPIATPGSSSGCSEGAYQAGELISLSGAIPDPGWQIAGWLGTDDDSSQASTNEVSMPGHSHEVMVAYEEAGIDCYSLSLSKSGDGADLIPSPGNSVGCPLGEYHAGVLIQLTAAPADNWVVDQWVGTLDDSSSEITNSVVMPSSSHTAGVIYQRIYKLFLPLLSSNYASVSVPPEAPTALSGTGVSHSSIDLTWTDNSSNESAFHIERSPSGAGSWTEIDTTAADAEAYSDTGLTCGTAYDYRVRAYRDSDAQYSDYSNIAAASTLACPPPAAPTSLTATPASSTQIDLAWIDNATDESQYRVERSPAGSASWTEIASLPVNSVSYSDDTASCASSYDYRVRAFRGSDLQYSSYSNVATATTLDCTTLTGLDPSFGTDGVVISNFGSGSDRAHDVILQPDGKIVIAGTYGGTSRNFLLARYLADGSLDTSFDSDGWTNIEQPGVNEQAYGVRVQPDGKLVAVGEIGDGFSHDFGVIRTSSTGVLDTTFSGDGIIRLDGGSDDDAYDVLLQSDGKILVIGFMRTGNLNDFAVLRYTTDGTLDTTFSGDGQAVFPLSSSFDEGLAGALQDDGKIVVSGYTTNGNEDFAVIRLNTDGSLDTSFSTDGMVSTAVGPGNERAHALGLQPDGKIVIAGGTHNGVDNDVGVVRYNADGTLDTTFSGDGIQTIDYGGGHEAAVDLIVLPDGRILLAGSNDDGVDDDVALFMLNADGSPDTTFGDNGVLTLDLTSGDDRSRALIQQSDGKVVVVGYADDDVFVLRLQGIG